MALTIEEENFVKELFAKNQKEMQIKNLSDQMWIEVDNLKQSDDQDKWKKIVELKQAFYTEKNNILEVE